MTSLSQIRFLGHGLQRPECVLAHASGCLFAPDWEGTGGISLTTPDGVSKKLLAGNAPFPLRPNGIALEPEGSFLLAHLGDTDGGIFRLYPDGSVETVLLSIDGTPLPPCNFVSVESSGRIWITVSTRVRPRADDYRRSANTGFIATLDPRSQTTGTRATGSGTTGARIVADNLGYTNECITDHSGRHLYVNETFARRLSRFTIGPNGDLDDYQVICRFEAGCFPDGMAIDSEGNIIVVSIVSNRVIKVIPTGIHTIMLEDVEIEHLDEVEQAWLNDKMDRPHLDRVKSQKLRNISNIAFGGPALDQAFFGCLLGQQIAYMQMDCAGTAPSHWQYDIDILLKSAAWKMAG